MGRRPRDRRSVPRPRPHSVGPLVSALEDRIVLGRGHEADGLMAATLTPGTRETPGSEAFRTDPAVTLVWAEVWTDSSIWLAPADRRRETGC